ncbi:protein phosphatase 2C 56-like isoform X2 [Herrania umbratica]|uniref:protein-serine/threonine phosphatase n=1 Tax=Herrania umbratica TaxID=108875 RepID=A0A6J0ZR48_9ROSI|nr:protein phosphatase 2C 56-like isoform X2 [Herrania umbratica]
MTTLYFSGNFKKIAQQRIFGPHPIKVLLSGPLDPQHQRGTVRLKRDTWRSSKKRGEWGCACHRLNFSSHVSHSYQSLPLSFYLIHSACLPSFLLFSLFSVTYMEPLLEEHEEQRFNRADSLPEPDLVSTSSSLSSILSVEDSRSTTSSGDISGNSGSSGDILTVEAAVPRLLEPAPACEELTVTVTARPKCVGRNNKGVTWGFTSVIGRRREMEDAIAVIPAFMSRTCDHVGGCTAPGSKTSTEISPIHFFGVYDGHGGSQVAQFCAERMHGVIAEEWDREMVESSGWKRRWEVAFSSSFERADDEVRTAAVAPEMVGSTAVVVVLSGCQIITSNCGDSRAVLCRGTETIPLTVDQKPDRQDELMRIEREGGRVINWNGARVFGVLAMSRAIGFPLSLLLYFISNFLFSLYRSFLNHMCSR